MAVQIILNPFTSAPPRSFTEGLLRLRGFAEDGGFTTRDTDLQQSRRIGKRLYLLDASYSSGAIHVRLSVRKAGSPRTKVLGVWRPQRIGNKTIGLIWDQIMDSIDNHEKKVRG